MSEPDREPRAPEEPGPPDAAADPGRHVARPRRPPRPAPRGRPARTHRVRAGAVAAAGVAAALVAWLVLGGDDGVDSAQPPAAEARAVTVAGLRELAAAQSGPVYWVGPRRGATYELSTAEGRVFVRYLPDGYEIGDRRGALTVATYPLADAYAALERAAEEEGAISTRVGNGLAVFDTERPANVYLAYPGSDRQIEVYAPTPKDARDAVFGGEVRQIPRSSAAPRLADEQALRRVSAAVGHPVYWAGTGEEGSYELTRAPGGVVFVRYLPEGAAAGDPAGHLTVATYPLQDPLGALRRAGADEGAQLAGLPGGGLLLTSEERPSNAYVAYPGAAVQVEVYDPEPGRAADLVRSGRIAPL